MSQIFLSVSETGRLIAVAIMPRGPPTTQPYNNGAYPRSFDHAREVSANFLPCI